MQTIRGLFLIVSSFTISICSLIQERPYINQSLFIVDEIIFDSYTLNPFSQSNSSTGFVSNGYNRNYDNTCLEVKTIQPILMNTELDNDDPLLKPYVLSAL
ncbi:MAG TPA: hypothetical protein VK492_15980 [Chitinophagaceae bacterium]|nr:hypothetical protein [Chitinophagaceae bacterium]